MIEWIQDWSGAVALVVSVVSVVVAVVSIGRSNASSAALRQVLEGLDVRGEEQAGLHLGSNRKLSGIEDGVVLVAGQSKKLVAQGDEAARRASTQLRVHICENLGSGCVDISAHPIGTEPVQVTELRVLYKDGSDLKPDDVPTYPVTLDATCPPESVEVSGPWVDIGGITPPYLMEEAMKRGGVAGIALLMSDGREHVETGHDVEEQLVRSAAKALRRWLEFQ